MLAKVVAGVGRRHHQTRQRRAGDSPNVGILTSRGDAGGSDRDDCARRQRHAAGQQVRRRQLIIGQNEIRQGDIAGVGNHVSPGHDATGINKGAGNGVGVVAISIFAQIKPRFTTKIVAGVGRRHHAAHRWLAGDSADIDILTGGGRAGDNHVDHLTRRQRDTGGERVLRRQLIVDQCDLGQGHIARVGDDIAPGDKVADDNEGAGRGVGV